MGDSITLSRLTKDDDDIDYRMSEGVVENAAVHGEKRNDFEKKNRVRHARKVGSLRLPSRINENRGRAVRGLLIVDYTQ